MHGSNRSGLGSPLSISVRYPVERGSTLSHSAVVARELGIPAVVNIPGLTELLYDGEEVTMDGDMGTVERSQTETQEGADAS